LRRQCHGTGDQVAEVPQRDVHGPIVTVELRELTRPIERIHDPDPLIGQPSRVVDPFLREHRICRASGL